MSVPLGGGGVSGEMRVFVFEGMGVLTRWASEGCAEVAAVGADEAELPGAGGQDLERSGVMGDVVTFTQGQQIGQVGAPAVDPVDAVVGVQVFGVRAAGVGAVAVLAGQQGAVLAVGDQAM